MFDLSVPLTQDVGEDVCLALENMFSLACNLNGPARIAFFCIGVLHGSTEVIVSMQILVSSHVAVVSSKRLSYYVVWLFGAENGAQGHFFFQHP